KVASVEAPTVAFDANSLARSDLEPPKNPNKRKHPEPSTESRVQHDQTEATTEDKTDVSNLATYFGDKPFVYEQTPVGVTMGLARTTPTDGLAWYLKATLVKEGEGIGCFNVIGQVGIDTYRSGCVAYKVAHQILRRKQPDNNFFTKSVVHLHFPKAGGQSAGCTMSTSLLSFAMNKPVRKNLAMTGEITLTGGILPVAYVKEKTIGARRSQVKTIIFPEGNRKDFDELPENLKEGLDVHFVDDYEQIFELAFNYDH
ncbi:unnamed protein product, partial [Thlaspi arvense]